MIMAFEGNIKEFDDVLLLADWSVTSRLSAINRAFGILELSPAGEILHANDNLLRLFGYSAGDLRGKGHAKLCHESTCKSAEYSEFWANLKRGVFVDQLQKRRHADGSTLWLQAIYVPILTSQGQVERILKIAIDVTHYQAIQQEAESKLAAISRSSGIVEFDLGGNILDANAKFADLLGYERDEIIGKSHIFLCDASYARSEDYRQFWDRLRSGEYFSGTFDRKRKDGTLISIHASYNPIFDLDGNVSTVTKCCHAIGSEARQLDQALTAG